MAELRQAAAMLSSICSHISIALDGEVPYLFAVGLKQFHSLDLRPSEAGLVLELWRGPNDADEFIREEVFSSLAPAVQAAEQWLGNDIA